MDAFCADNAQEYVNQQNSSHTARTSVEYPDLNPKPARAKVLQPDPSPLIDIVLTNLEFLGTVLLARN